MFIGRMLSFFVGGPRLLGQILVAILTLVSFFAIIDVLFIIALCFVCVILWLFSLS